jgi:hypothetical protein
VSGEPVDGAASCEHGSCEDVANLVQSRAWVILGLSGLAVTQPLLDLFGRNPEFFVAGNYSRTQIVMFALIVALVPAVFGIALTALATIADHRAGTVVFMAVTAVLAAALVLAVLRTLKVDSTGLVVAMALVVGVGTAILVVRTRGARLFVSYLAVANVFFVGSFLSVSRTSELVLGDSGPDVEAADLPPLRGPIVLIVLDELPAASIMRADGTINAERYPGFASLAEVSTWFRNASASDNYSHRATPAILTGTIAGEDDLPTLHDHPRNLFTMFGERVPVRRYEPLTDLCPSSICEPSHRDSLRQALEDASVVYGHRVLPSSLRDQLPAIDDSWGDYGAQDAVAAERDGSEAPPVGIAGNPHLERAYSHLHEFSADERSPRGQAQALLDEIAAIDGSPSLHFVHVLLPHRPYVLSRTGIVTSYYPGRPDQPEPLEYAFRARLRFQLHSMQVGATDNLIAELVQRLRSLPTWEQTLLVVTSDHGDTHTPPYLSRLIVNDSTREEIFRVPLFIKAPGQVTGEVRDDSAQTIDVLPSIADLVGAEVEWEFDGHSLYDGSTAHTTPKVSIDVEEALAIARRRAEEYPYGYDWTALAAVGPNGDLVGRQVQDLPIGSASDYRASLNQDSLLSDLPGAAGTMPFVLAGRVSGPNGTRQAPPEFLAAVNGTVAGVVGGYRPEGSGWSFTGYVADFYRHGANEVDLYEVSRPGGVPTLHLVNRDH